MNQKIIVTFYFKSGNSIQVEQLYKNHDKDRKANTLSELYNYIMGDMPKEYLKFENGKLLYHNTVIDMNEVEAIEVISCAHADNGWIMDIDLGE